MLDEGTHEAEEEGQKQGTDMAAVHIGIGHDDHLVIAELVKVELLADAGAQGGNDRLELVVAVDLVGPGLLHVEHLAPQGEDSLEAGVPALGGGAACGVTLDDVELGELGVISGIFLPVQYGAIAALKTPEEEVLEQCRQYDLRNRTLCQGLRRIGWQVPDSQGTMFVWAPLPEGYTNSEQFCMELMERSGVICVPGSSFGNLGEGYVRFALVLPPKELENVVESIERSGILK